MANIGGILGLGFSSEGGGDFWQNNKFTQKTYGVQLTPNASDWSWMANPPNISEKEASYIEFGALDLDMFSNDTLATMLVSKVQNAF